MSYIYGMKSRPAGPGAQPGRLDHIEEDPTGKYWNIIVYRRELTPEEIRDFELDYIGRGNDEN